MQAAAQQQLQHNPPNPPEQANSLPQADAVSASPCAETPWSELQPDAASRVHAAWQRLLDVRPNSTIELRIQFNAFLKNISEPGARSLLYRAILQNEGPEFMRPSYHTPDGTPLSDLAWIRLTALRALSLYPCEQLVTLALSNLGSLEYSGSKQDLANWPALKRQAKETLDICSRLYPGEVSRACVAFLDSALKPNKHAWPQPYENADLIGSFVEHLQPTDRWELSNTIGAWAIDQYRNGRLGNDCKNTETDPLLVKALGFLGTESAKKTLKQIALEKPLPRPSDIESGRHVSLIVLFPVIAFLPLTQTSFANSNPRLFIALFLANMISSLYTATAISNNIWALLHRKGTYPEMTRLARELLSNKPAQTDSESTKNS
ncbi:MAG: hypothetical protein K1X83_15485 [Oligoflexia bacterium]|nr:hypothetical protein [Oligoflexia bacterium]